MRTEAASISLAGSTLGDTRHVCAFFNNDDEEYRVLLPFNKDGFDRGDKAIHVVNPDQRQDHLQRLATIGLDTAAAAQRGQFELRTNTDTYLWDGRFDQERMLAVFEQLASGNATQGFPLSHIVCRMDWLAEARPAVDDVIEFELRVNDIWRRHDDAAICTDHLHHFSGDAVIDIMRTHPLVIIGGTLHRNPFFVPPDQFVPEFRERRAKQARLIVDCIPAQVAVLAATGEIKQVNRRMADFFGNLESLDNWRTGDIVPPDELPRVLAAMKTAFETGEAFEIENHLRRFDGVYRWFQIRGLPLKDSNGRTIRWYFLITDIEERKHAEEALRRSEAFLAQAQRVSSIGSFSWRLDTDEMIFSDELYRIFELDQHATLNLEQIRVRVHPDDTPLLSKLIDQARASGGNLEYEMRLRMPDGRIKHTRTFGEVIHHPDGQRECLGAIQDVTEHHLSNDALDKARTELAHVTRSMSLGALTASVAHEVNQPLSGIMTNAGTCLRMLDGTPPDINGARETARRTIRDANRASDVISRLRALFGRKPFELEPLDLNDATREVVALSSIDLKRNDIVLRSELADELPIVRGDRIQLQQVVLNLLRNASDAMVDIGDRPRHVLLRTCQDDGGGVRVTVRDTGVGLPPGSVDSVCQPFYSTKSGGMGIGLFVSRSIVEQHQGRLWVERNDDGPGATFSFVIPVAAESVGTLTPR